MERSEQKGRERDLYFFKRLLEQSADPYHVISPEEGFRFVYVNPAACRHYGRSIEKLLTMRVPDWDPLFTIEKCEEAWKKLKSEGPLIIETLHRHADGHDIPVEVSVNYLEYGGREYIGGSVRNITERKRGEKALRDSEAKFRQLVALLPTAVYTCSTDGELTFFNERAVTMWGRTPNPGETGEQFCGCLEAFAENGKCLPREELPLLAACRKGRSFRNVEGIIQRPYGSRINVLANIDPVRDAEGRVVGVISVLTDITAQKEVEKVLQSQNQRLSQLAEERERLTRELRRHTGDLERTVGERTSKLSELVAEMEQMSYSIIHDMRAPLRAIQGYAVIIQRQDGKCLSPESLDYLSRIMRSADRMDRLITDAFNYSKAVRQGLALEPVDVAELLREMVTGYPDFQTANIRLEGEFPRVMGNRAGLTQCFSELLGNAIKFVKPGELPQVKVWAEFKRPETAAAPSRPAGETQPPQMVRLWFEDKGTGIPRESQPRIFQMFERMHGKEYEGTGIGLALVRKVTERMGGRVGVESELGKGSRFWLELRAAQSEDSLAE